MVNPVSGTSSTTDLKPATHPLLPRLALFRCGPGSLELRSHCPPTSTPRCRQHTEDCAADHPTRRCRRVRGNGRLIGRRVLEVDAWSNEGFNWLGEVIRYESARLASWELIKVMRQVHHHPRRWFQGSGRGTLSETASISLEKRPVRRVKIAAVLRLQAVCGPRPSTWWHQGRYRRKVPSESGPFIGGAVLVHGLCPDSYPR